MVLWRSAPVHRIPTQHADGTKTVTVEGVRMELDPGMVAAVVPVVAAFSGLVGHWTARGKQKAETTKLLVETAEAVVETLNEHIEKLKTEFKEQEARCNEHVGRVTQESEARCEERLQEAGRKRDEQYRLLQERLVALERDRDEERAGREEDRQAYIASWESGRPLPQGEQ